MAKHLERRNTRSDPENGGGAGIKFLRQAWGQMTWQLFLWSLSDVWGLVVCPNMVASLVEMGSGSGLGFPTAGGPTFCHPQPSTQVIATLSPSVFALCAEASLVCFWLGFLLKLKWLVAPFGKGLVPQKSGHEWPKKA